ncbi:MAG: replicative DNA helicase [Rikenellaceae bacterium]
MTTYDETLERSIIGALIIDNECRPDVMALLQEPEAFTNSDNRAIFEQIRTNYDKGEAIDMVSICTAPALRSKIAYVSSLAQCVGSGASALTHSRLLVENFMRGRMQSLGSQLAHKAQSDGDIGDTFGWAQKELNKTLGVVTGGDVPKHISEVLKEAINELEQRAMAHAKGEAVGIPTGLADLDRVTGGWRGGQLVVLAGRPAMGKSAVMMHFAKAAAESSRHVVIFSAEMKCRELGDRLILGGSKIDGSAYKVGSIGSEEWWDVEAASKRLGDLPIYISDSSQVSMQQIRAQCQLMQAKGRCDMVMIDYLQLLDTQSRSRQFSREREVAEATRQAKILANELDVPIILLSQLSRKVEERSDKTPMLSDLRESGAIEQDADMVAFIHRPYYYDRETKIDTAKHGQLDPKGIGVLIVAKQRNGQTGRIFFNHSADLNQIQNIS